MPQRQLYIHIGRGKTGTSALQTFFMQNRALLKRYEIIYPLCGGARIDNHYLAWSLLKEEGVERTYPANIRTSAEEWDYVLSQLIGKRNLISSELFGGLSFEAVSKVKEYVSGFEVKVIVYLRRHDRWLEALYNQKVKGKGICSLPQRQRQKDTVEIWANGFSKENIIVRPYETGQFYQGTIFADFLHYAFGLSWTDEFTLPPADINSHLHRIVMEYKRMVNYLPPPGIRLIPPAILQELSKSFFDSGRKDDSVFSPQARLEMINENAPQYAEIAKEYLGRQDGRLFYESLPDPNEPWQPYELLEDDARLINDYLAQHHPKTLRVIIAGIDAARKSDDPDVQQAARRLTPGILITSGKPDRSW